MAVTYEEVLHLARQLTSAEQTKLAHELKGASVSTDLIAALDTEMQSLRADGAFQNNDNLYEKFGGTDLSYEDIEQIIHEAATAWEKEWDNDGNFIG